MPLTLRDMASKPKTSKLDMMAKTPKTTPDISMDDVSFEFPESEFPPTVHSIADPTELAPDALEVANRVQPKKKPRQLTHHETDEVNRIFGTIIPLQNENTAILRVPEPTEYKGPIEELTKAVKRESARLMGVFWDGIGNRQKRSQEYKIIANREDLQPSPDASMAGKVAGFTGQVVPQIVGGMATGGLVVGEAEKQGAVEYAQELGLDVKDQELVGSIVGGVNYLIETAQIATGLKAMGVIGKEAVDEFKKKAIKGAVKKILASGKDVGKAAFQAGIEGGIEEALQETTLIVTPELTQGKNPLPELWDKKGQVGMAGVGGFFAEGMTGGLARGTNLALSRLAQTKSTSSNSSSKAGAGQTDTVAPAVSKPTFSVRPDKHPTVEVPVSELTISEEVPNFKEGADEATGVVKGQELQGTYTRLGTAPVLVWERKDGSKEVVTGRHRLDLAKRTGEETIPSQIVREADGFTKEMALTFDAESNIRDGQGTVKDYAHYFKNSRITEEQARQRGLLSRTKGDVGFRIGKGAADDIYAAFAAGKLTESKTYAIANGAAGNESAQLAAAEKSNSLSADELEQYARILNRTTPSDSRKATQGNLFGFDDTALQEAELVAKEVAKEQRHIKDRILSVQGALRRPEAARKMGLEFSDETSIRNEVARLEDRLDELSRVSATPELYRQMRQRAGLAETVAPTEDRLLEILPNKSTVIYQDKAGVDEINNIGVARKKILAYANANFAGKTVTVKSNGDEVLLTKSGIKHGVANGPKDKIRAVSVLPEIIESSVYQKEFKDRRNRPDIKAIHEYKSILKENDGLHEIVIVVRETKDGKRYYDHYLDKKIESAGSSRTTDEQLGSGPATDSTTNNIPKKETEGQGKSHEGRHIGDIASPDKQGSPVVTDKELLRQLDIDPETVSREDTARIVADYREGIDAASLSKPPRESGKLPGGKRSGGTTILSDLASETVGLGHKVTQNPVQFSRAAVKMAVRNIKAGNNHIRTLGNAGRRTAEELDSIVFRATKATNIDNDDIRQIYKGLPKKHRETVAKIVNGQLEPSTQKPALVERANKLREILDRSMNAAKDAGMYRMVNGKKVPIGGSGKAFPQIPNEAGIKFLNEAEEKGLASDRVFAWATEQVKSGQFDSVDQAVSMLQMFRENRLRGVNRYLESTRVDLPEEFIEWDGAKVLSHLTEKNWLTIEGVRAWGNNFNLVNSRAEQIAARYGRKEAERVKQFIKTSFGVISPASTESQRISDIIRGYQFNTKVGLSPLTILRNMTDRIAKSMTLTMNLSVNASTAIKYPPFINQFIKSSQKLEREMIRRGAVFGHGSLSEGYEAGSVLSDIAGHPFSASERGNQVQIAITKYLQLKKDLATLEKRGGKDAITTRIANRLNIPFKDSLKYRISEHGGQQILDKAMKGEPIPNNLIDEVLHRTVRDKAFPMVISTKPLWYDAHPMARVMAQFKTWPMKQTAMIWNDVVKYTVKTGDPRRLIGFLVGTLVAGEIYNILRDFLYDKDESMLSQALSDGDGKDIAKAALEDLLDGGVVGMLADFTYGLYNWTTGVSFNTAANIKEAVVASYKRPGLTVSAIKRLIEKEATPVRQILKLADKVDRNYINNKKNVTKDYYRVRGWAWDFRNQYQNPTKGDKIEQFVDDLIYGKAKYKPGDNTLAYQMASRQLQVGDIDDAAGFFRNILKHGGNPSTIRRTMLTNYSPYGHIRDKDEPRFLKSLSPDERKIARDVQRQWYSNFREAMAKARE